ncbi:MAG: BrnA antitoxin family protein [Elusimicrobia bacterium]|nr:BrnA antitoxin family protein [Elusimicrobiota bacterium]
MKKGLKKVPEFKNSDEEFRFWSTHDLSDYADLAKAKQVVFPNLKPTSRPVFIKVPLYLLNELKNLANKKGVPYQSLMKVYLEQKVREEFK